MQNSLSNSPHLGDGNLHRFSTSALASLLRRVGPGTTSEGLLAKIVAQILVATDSDEIRNAAAIALADLRAHDEADALVEVIRRPELAGRCGSLIFALDELGASLPFDLMVQLIRTASYEGKAEALLFMEGGRVLLPHDETYDRLVSELDDLQYDNDAETAEAARVALSHVSRAGPRPSPG